jgi:hypothetical protein
MLMFKRKTPPILWALVLMLVAPAVLHAAPPRDEGRMGNLPPLRTLRTQHYQIRTDLDEDLAKELGQRMDMMFGEYQRRLADFAVNREFQMLDVYLFRRKEDYMAYTVNRFPNTGGVFMAGRVNALAAFLEGQGRDALKRTLQHEAFHQFAHNAISPDLPIWLNEGMAQVFEEGLWTGEKFMLGQVPPRRLRQLKSDIEGDRLVEFRKFLTITPDEWSKTLAVDANRGATQYNQAWAMTHYLIHGENGALRPRVIRLLQLIHAGTEAEAAWKTAFSDNYAGFQRKFTGWANGVTATPEATMIDRQGVLGDLVVSLHGNGQKFRDMAAFRKTVTSRGYQLQYTKGDVTWKTEPRLDVYFSNVEGQVMNNDNLYFDPTNGPLPDIVCQMSQQLRLRTRFYEMSGKMWHEMQIEAK